MKYVSEKDMWFPVEISHRFQVGDEVRTPDGLVKVIKVFDDYKKFYAEIITAIHDDVRKGEKYEYSSIETTILAKVKDTKRLPIKDTNKKGSNYSNPL